jgi:hypothetical protein
MARKTAADAASSNPDRDRFIAECMRQYAMYFVVRGYAAPEQQAIDARVKNAGEYYDLVVAPYAMQATEGAAA